MQPQNPYNPQQQWNQPPPPYPGAGGYQPYNQNPMGGFQTEAPGSGTAHICGIIGIILCLGLIGVILNIIAIVNGNNAMEQYNAFPGRYTEASFRKAKTGRTLGIVGLCLFGGIIVIALLVALAVNI